MGEHAKVPPDKLQGKQFKCHPKQNSNVVVCIVCEETFHLSDFKRLKNTKFIGDILVVCDAHKNLTANKSQIKLGQEEKLLIAEIKESAYALAQEKLQQGVHSVLPAAGSSSHDITALGDDDADIKTVIAENVLLRQLNEELKHKNSLLVDMIELTKSNQPSYSSITKPKPSKPLKIPDIKVKANSDVIGKGDTFRKVAQIIQKEIRIPFKNVLDTKSNGTIIKCANGVEVSRASNILKEKLGQDFDVEIQQAKNPRLKVVGVDSAFSGDELEDDINNRNFNEVQGKCKVVKTFKSGNGTMCAIIEVTRGQYEILANNKFRIYIGHTSYRTYDSFDVFFCNKCAGFNHKSNFCNKTFSQCIFCAGDHSAGECTVELEKHFKCPNCVYANEKYGHKYDTCHIATDVQCCEILKKRLSKLIDNTDYPYPPELPKFLWPYAPSTKPRGKLVNSRGLTSGRNLSVNGNKSSATGNEAGGTEDSDSNREHRDNSARETDVGVHSAKRK